MGFWIVWSKTVKPKLTGDYDEAYKIAKEGGFTVPIRCGEAHLARIGIKRFYIPAYESGELDKTIR